MERAPHKGPDKIELLAMLAGGFQFAQTDTLTALLDTYDKCQLEETARSPFFECC